MRVPLRGNGELLEVIEIPLDLPVLNSESFRIAPSLEEHPQADLVRTDPYSSDLLALLDECEQSWQYLPVSTASLA